ncbi:hypothetical protein [Palleronia abyssalis]|uniref:DUF4760 domain-containing protein n=1 Tax=Palleronia abyssalis TaxID=1501240 RepID=A0A2R8BVW2_9RHOB|nr:hypothetical protein [Palleronia abyssalis]SPJ24265.1 hypothetical protein PAA8504_02093 [Palleronia abyssalis]
MSAATEILRDPRIWQAVVAGAFVAVGWLVNGWQNRRERYADRMERLRDSHRAIYAEIGANLFNLGSPEALTEHAEVMCARMVQDSGFVPFVPTERPSPVFDALVAQIHVLPRVSIDPIVAYYLQLRAIREFASDMRGDVYAKLSPERRSAIYRDYIEMKIQAFLFGDHALRIIAEYAAEGKDSAEDLARRLSNRGGDRSDP